MNMLRSSFTGHLVEAGCDEAGRGCLAGPVFAAAVILPKNYANTQLNDSKQLSEKDRYLLRPIIERDAISWAVARVEAPDIDRLNILQASIHAMHIAIGKLKVTPELLLIDGNRFMPLPGMVYQCIIKGDAKFMAIAAASILAKTYRDDYMCTIHEDYPRYDWKTNKGYPVRKHREAIAMFGLTQHHRLTFRCGIAESH